MPAVVLLEEHEVKKGAALWHTNNPNRDPTKIPRSLRLWNRDAWAAFGDLPYAQGQRVYLHMKLVIFNDFTELQVKDFNIIVLSIFNFVFGELFKLFCSKLSL